MNLYKIKYKMNMVIKDKLIIHYIRSSSYDAAREKLENLIFESTTMHPFIKSIAPVENYED